MTEEEIRVLLVDDERMVRRSMEKTLLRAGYDVDTAASAGDGLALFNQALEEGEPFDIALLDLNMPNLEGEEDAKAGLELLGELMKIDRSFPVVVLTAFDEVTLAKEAVSLGAKAYFVKGRERGLLDLIEDILED